MKVEEISLKMACNVDYEWKQIVQNLCLTIFAQNVARVN